MKILLTGGNGFIGSQLNKRFSKEGHQVITIDDCSSQSFSKQKPNYHLDISDFKKISQIIAKEKPDVVSLHAAKMNHHTKDVLVKTNIEATQNLIAQSVRHSVKYIMFASSAAVYKGNKKPVKEKNASDTPPSLYGLSKKIGEQLLEAYTKDTKTRYICFRYANVYGPTQHYKNGGVISKFVKSAKQDESLLIHQQGKQIRDFVFIDDVVEANIKALNKLTQGIFNISTGQGTSISEIIKIIQKKYPDLKVSYTSDDQGVPSSILSNSQARKILKWTPQFSLEDGLTHFF